MGFEHLDVTYVVSAQESNQVKARSVLCTLIGVHSRQSQTRSKLGLSCVHSLVFIHGRVKPGQSSVCPVYTHWCSFTAESTQVKAGAVLCTLIGVHSRQSETRSKLGLSCVHSLVCIHGRVKPGQSWGCPVYTHWCSFTAESNQVKARSVLYTLIGVHSRQSQTRSKLGLSCVHSLVCIHGRVKPGQSWGCPVYTHWCSFTP